MKNNRQAWVSVPDICEIYPLSPNTNPKEIEIYSFEVQEFDLPNVLNENLISLIDTNIKLKIQQWKNKTYNQGDKVFYDNVYYIAKQTTTDNPENSNEWEVFEAMTFYHNFVKPFMCMKTMEKYAPLIGLHMTQWGLEQYSQDSFSQVTDKRRSELLNQIKGKSNVYLYKLEKELKGLNYILDGVEYKTECKIKKASFSVIGASTKRVNYDYNYKGYRP